MTKNFQEQRQESFVFYQECLQPGAVAPIDVRMRDVVVAAWDIGDWLFPSHSCEGHSLEEQTRGARVERLAKRWGNLSISYRFTQFRKDTLLTGLPGCVKIEHHIDHSIPRQPREDTWVLYQWWYERRDEAIAAIVQTLGNLKVNVPV